MNNIKTWKLFFHILVSISLLTSSNISFANQYDICQETDIRVAYFNGVQTTPSAANRALRILKNKYGEYSPSGGLITYEGLYNHSKDFEDFVEVFEQRLIEHGDLLEGRFELFLEVINGDGPWWSRIIESVPSAQELLSSLLDWYEAFVINQLTSYVADPPTQLNYAEHRTRIDSWILEGNKLLFIAHSQGNLFANVAYDYALTKTTPETINIVHIAPASPKVNGPYTLAGFDLVINALRAFGSVPDNTTDIPAYLERPPGINGETDILGHGLLEIYLNPQLATSTRISQHINEALLTLEAPEREAAEGLFTATLTWNGGGDVDLHTFEPDGFHVFWQYREGHSGFLDVDETGAYGPEHYYAKCDSSTIQTGVYTIAVANYKRADGITATVQISSWNNGVLGTKSVVLGERTQSEPGFYLFDVLVSKNEETGIYSVSIEQ